MVLEPIVAMRTWWLGWDPRHTAPVLVPPIVGGGPWPPREPARAVCRRRRWHAVPGVGCLCGLHATNDEARLRRTRSPGVAGTVAIWGRVIEHEHGYRAEVGYPQRLRLVCFLCVADRGLESVRPAFVARLPRARLVPLCEDHLELARRYDLRILDVVGASRIEQALLDAYAVDRLAV